MGWIGAGIASEDGFKLAGSNPLSFSLTYAPRARLGWPIEDVIVPPITLAAGHVPRTWRWRARPSS